jgi:hypothetical protein
MASIIDLLNEGNEVKLTSTRTSPTTITLTWNIPVNPQAYNGCVVLISTNKITELNKPTDGVRYLASSDLSLPQGTIGGANVIKTIYGAFGDNVTNNSVVVTNLTPDTIYYACIYICDNVLQYYSAGSKSYVDDSHVNLINEPYASNLPEALSAPLNPTLGQVYYHPTENKVFMWTGAAWIQANTNVVVRGTSSAYTSGTSLGAYPVGQTGKDFSTAKPPVDGDFFYNTVSNTLYVFAGTGWIPANVVADPVPQYEKVPIGDTGSNRERTQLVEDLKNQLGWPGVCAELDESQFNLAVDLSLREIRRRSDSAYYRKHLLFGINANQNIYYLNDPTNGSDKIVDIIKISRISQFGINAIGGDNGVYSQTFFNQVFQSGQMIDILSIYLIAQLGEEYTRLFAGDLMYEWREGTRELTILRKLYKNEPVVLEVVMEKPEQELIVDRWTRQWVYDWSLACCFEMLSMIRGKYQSLPGPGGISMNGDTLGQKADTMKLDLLRQIIDFELGNNVDMGNSWILLG